MGALAGCQESGFDESKETQRPLKVQDAMNPLNGTKVPGQAERPATLTADTLGDTLALGVTPVVASDVPDYMRADARGVRVVKDTDLSGIRAATPDVILGTKEKQGDEYTDLSKIAPTILTEGDDWKLNLREHGEALGPHERLRAAPDRLGQPAGEGEAGDRRPKDLGHARRGQAVWAGRKDGAG